MRRVSLLICLICLISPMSRSLEIAETRMTGQYPVECAPTVIEYRDQPALLSVNRGGQVMLWSVEGKDLGPGPGGIDRDTAGNLTGERLRGTTSKKRG